MVSKEPVFYIFVSSVLISVAIALDPKFPPGFRFGVSTASYQIEGAWNVSDKAESIWDRLIHVDPTAVYDGNSGDVACDSYHQWRRDVHMVHELGVHFYRFSISWSGLLPNGFANKVSETGKKYYSDLIDTLIAKGIEPAITLYHWDLPQKLQDLGGWTNPYISDWFADYARVVFSLYADRVKIWFTINEPNIMCDINYNLGILAPRIRESEVAALLCNKHVLVAHAKAYRMYKNDFKPKYHGRIAIVNQLTWMEAATEEDEDVAEFARQSCISRYSHPIYSKRGGWPPSVVKAMADYSRRAGYPRSKLPAFTKEEIALIRGTYDFYGYNYYTARIVRRSKPGDDSGVWSVTGYPEFNITLEMDPEWPLSGPKIIKSYPAGLRKNIAWIRKEYGMDLEIFISENGYGDNQEDLNDHDRMKYMKRYLEEVLFSIQKDGANIKAYAYWSLMDIFEWFEGYGVKYGLYQVDFKDPMRTRTPRASAHYYAQLIKKHSLAVPMTSKTYTRADTNRNNSRSIEKEGFLSIIIGLFLLYTF